MGDSTNYHSEGDNRAPRKNRSHQKNEQRSPQDKTDRSRSYDEDRRSNQHYNERGESRNQQRSPTRDQYHRERAPKERSRNSDYERDQNHEEKKHQQSNHRERSHNQYKERDQYVEDKAQHRNQHGASGDWYKEREKYYEEKAPSRNQHEMSRYHEREGHRENHLYTVDQLAKNRENDFNYKVERSFSPHGSRVDDMEYYEPESDGGILDCHKCRYLCTGRACCQMVEILLNMLILICCSVSYNSTGGYTGLANLGGIYYYQFGGAYSGFSGADGDKAQALDVQFYELKLPTVVASMALGGALMGFCCLLVLLGVLRIPWRFPIWLLVEFLLDILIAVGYIPALYFFIRKLQEAYDSQICKDRESLYNSKGYKGFTCALHGADIAAVLFACMAIIAFCLSAVLTIKGYRRVRSLKNKPVSVSSHHPIYRGCVVIKGILQVLEVVLNALVLICLISSYFVLSGFSAGLSGGGFGNTNYPFEGQELKDVRQLDQQFTFMRAPLLYGGLAVSVLMGSITLGVAAAGAKHLLSLTGAWLLAEAIFSTLASLGYCAAVGVFLHFALQINSTDVCKKRERLYARNGLTWMNCDLAGTDGGVATFGILLVILYGASVVLAVRAYRERKLLQRECDDRRRDPDYVR
ncbi:MARVEL domain-containing protein 3 [Discoglossus pictus]